MDDNKRKLYDLMSQSYEMPSFEQFAADLNDNAKRRQLYDALSNRYDMPDFTEFSSQLLQVEQPAQTQTPTQPAPTQQAKPTAPAQQKKVKGQSVGTTTYQQATPQSTYGMSDELKPYYTPGATYTPSAKVQTPKAKAPEKVQQKAAQYRAQSAQRGREYAEAVAAQEQAGIVPGSLPFGMTSFENGRNMVREGADETNAEIAELDKQIELRKREIDAAIQPKTAMGRFAQGLQMAENSGYNPMQSEYAQDPQLQLLMTARHKAAQRKRVYDREQGQYNFIQTVGQVLASPDTWDFGVSQLRDAYVMAKYGDKELSGEQAKAKEAMMRNALQTQQVQQTLGQNDTGWQRWGDIAAQAVPFVAEFALTGGGYGALSAGGRYLGKRAAINVARNLAEGSIQRKVAYSLVKNTGVLAGDLAASLAMVNTTGAAKTWGGILDAHNGRVTVDADGNYKLTDGKPWAQAIYEGEVRQLLEYYTEKLGGHLPGTEGIAKFAEKLGAKRVSNALLHMTNSDWARMMGRFGVNDYPSEVIEEEANMILGAILAPEDPNNRWAEFLNPQAQCDIFVGMALSIGAMQLPGAVTSTAQYYKCKHEADKADVFAQTLIGDRWGEMRERIDNATNETLSGVMADIMADKTLNETQRGVAAEYIKDIAYMRGFNLRTIANAKTDDEQQVAIETAQGDAFSRGYNADAEELAQIIADFEAANEAQGDYNEKAMAYMGAMQRLDEDIDMEASQQKLAIEQQTGEDGSVHVAYVSTGKEGEYREVYVKGGYIATNSDGTIDANASDQTVAVFDPQEGKVVMMPTSGSLGLHHMGAVTPASKLMAFMDQQAQQRKDEALNAARQAASGVAPTAAADVAGASNASEASNTSASGWVQGVPETIAPGMEVVVKDADGTEVQGVITGNVRYENGEFVADPNGNMVEVVADGEAMHFYPSNAEDWLVSWYAGEEEPVAEGGNEISAEQTEGEAPAEVATDASNTSTSSNTSEVTPGVAPETEQPVAEEAAETAAPRTPEEEYAAMMADGMLDYDEASAIIDNNIKEAEKALDKITKGKPKPGTDVAAFKAAKQQWQDDVAVAQAAVDYWNAVKVLHVGTTTKAEPTATEQYTEPIGPRDIRAYEQPAGPEERKAVATEQYERAIGPERKAVASEQYTEPAGPRDIRAYEQPIGPEEAVKRESESAEDVLKTVNELFSVADTYSKIEAATIVSDAFDKGIDIPTVIEGYEIVKEAKEYIEAYKRYRAGEDVDYLYIKTGMTRDEVIADVQGIFSSNDTPDNFVGSMTDIELLTAEELDYKRWKYSVDSDVIDDNFAISAISDFCKRMEDKYGSKGEVLPIEPENGEKSPEAKAPAESVQELPAGPRVDKNGNQIGEDGKLITEKVNSIDEITDDDFENPTRSIELPQIPKNVDEAIGANGKPVVIKKNIFEKNKNHHGELSSDESRDILRDALYNPDLIGNNQQITRPDYKVAIKTGDKNSVVVLDVYQGKDNVEVVGWRKVNDKGLENMKRQAEREGGQFLILAPNNGSAADLSTLPSDLSSDGKDTKISETGKEKVEESSEVVENEGGKISGNGDVAGEKAPATVAETEKVEGETADRNKLIEDILGWSSFDDSERFAIDRMSVKELNELKKLIGKNEEASRQKDTNAVVETSNAIDDMISSKLQSLEDATESKTSEASDTINTSGVEGEAAAEPAKGEGYTLTPKKYTTKKGKEIDMFVLKFDRELSKDEFAALKADAKTRFEWWSKEDGGFLVRSEDNARHMAELLGSKEAVEDAKPATMEEVKRVAEEKKDSERWEYRLTYPYGDERVEVRRDDVSGPIPIGDGRFSIRAKNIEELGEILRNNGYSELADEFGIKKKEVKDESKPGQPKKVDVMGVMNELNEKGEAKLSDHVEGESKSDDKSAPKGEQKRIVSDERMAELKERMRKKLLGQLNIGVDPELLAIGAELAVGHIERGLTKFADYAKQMIEDIGDAVRPYLKSFYNAVRDMPEAADYADKMDAYEDVREYDVASIGREEAPTKEEVAAQERNEEVAEKSAAETEREIKKSVNEKKGVSLQAENEPAVSRRGQLDEAAVGKFVNQVRDTLTKALSKGNDKPFKSIVELRKLANELGLGVDMEGRDDVLLNELVEDAIVSAARGLTVTEVTRKTLAPNGGNVFDIFDRDVYDKVCRLYEMQPSINARSSNRIALQQYSTPIPMGFIADKFANGGRNEIGLEITAGNGMLVAFIPPVRLDVNEIDETRLSNLRKGGYRNVTDKDATEDYGKPKEYDFIVSNPPFGHTDAKDYDGYSISGLEHQIAINALNQMKDDGKAAIVIGGNMEYAPNGSVKSQKAFWSYLYDHYNVKGVIDMAGDLYKKQGTTYPTRMILIDGRRSEDERAQVRVFPPVKENAYRPANTFDDLWDIANEIINDNRKHNGTEILRSGAGQPVPDSKQQSGNGDGRTGGSKPAKNDGAAAGAGRRGSAGLERDAQQGESVLQRGSGQDAGTGTAGNRTGESGGKVRGNDTAGTDRGTGADAVRRVADGGVRSGSERLEQKKSAPAKVERKDEKRELDTEKLPYRQHNTAFSLESVAPASMVEAMDETLKRIEDKYGNIDDFVTDELGYASVDEMHAALAAEQVDSVAMAIAQMKDGQGFVIGDQTGVGKGRQMAALIRWANKQGKKPVFFTQKADLFTDIYRDLADVGSAGLVPFIVNSDGAMLDSDGKAVYKPLSAEAQKKIFDRANNPDMVLSNNLLPEEYDFVVVTYSQVNTGDAISAKEANEAKKASGARGDNKRQEKMETKATPKATWIRKMVNGNYLFMDESHTGAGQSNTGYYMQSISKAAKAVTYASATFAKRPDTMPLYAMRTAMSEANVPLNDLIGIIQKGGVTLQEIMSRAMTSAGQMVRRERDMSDVRTDWKTIDDPEIVKKARSLYDRTITAFNAIIQFQEKYVNAVIAADDLQAAFQMESVGNKRGTKKMGIENVPFASKTYNYTKQIMLALKVDAIVNEVEAEINAGRHPVIALESTMESTFKDFAGMELPEPTFAASLLRGLETVMQYTKKDDKGNGVSGKYLPSDLGEEGEQAYYELQDFIRESTSDIFISPLDAIIEGLRAKGYKVGELTGRSTVVEKDDNGKYVVRKRTDKDKKKMQREFNSGALDVLILNKSASTGISLHASNKFSDQRQRSMIIAQPLSDINDYMQMIGRIDRTGQVHRGYYINLGLPVPAESRFLMMLSTKLKSLNANTTSAQESKSNEVEAPDLLNKYGSQMVVEYLKDHFDIYEKLGFPLKSGDGKHIKTSTELADYTAKEDDARKITGYVALLSTDEQEDFYNDVVQRYTDHVKYLDDTGANDLKITVMPLRTETLEKKVSSPGTNPEGSNPFAHNAYVERVSMDILRKPMKADEIRKLIETINGDNNGEALRERLQNAIRELAQKHLDAEAERNEARKERDRKIVEEYAAKINAQDKLSAEEKADAIAKREAELEVKRDEQYENAVKRTKSSDNLFYQRVGSFKVGKTYLIPEDLHGSSLNMFTPAIFCGFKAKEDKLTQSSTQAVFAILNGIRKLEIKLSDGEALSNISSCTMTNYNAASETGLYNWDGKIPTGSRKEGYIITGNILQAVGDTQQEDGSYAGQLISYTDMEGNIHDGILMPDKWQPNMLKNSGVPINARLKQIKDGSIRYIESTDGKVKLEKRWSGWDLSVPKTKKEGGKYFENEELVHLAGYQGFYQRNGVFHADINDEDIAKAVSILSKLGVRVEENTGDGGDTRYRTSEELDEFDVRDRIAEIVGARGAGMSKYAHGTTEDGQTYTIRVSNHAAREANFGEHDEDESDIIVSLIVDGEFAERYHKGEPMTDEDNGRYQFVIDPKDFDEEFFKNAFDKFKESGRVDLMGSDVVFRTGKSDTATSPASMRSAVEDMAGKLKVKVRVVEDAEEITDSNKRRERKKRKAKGYYDLATGEVVVVLPNHATVADAMATVAHEVIGHKGMRELVGEENYPAFLDEVYSHLEGALKERIDREAGRDFMSDPTTPYEEHRRVRMDELFAEMAEKPFEDFTTEERTFWQTIKDAVRRLLDKLLGGAKLPKWFTIGDNEIRYMLWRAKENLERGKEDPIQFAQDIMKRRELGIDSLEDDTDPDGPRGGGNGGGKTATDTTPGDGVRYLSGAQTDTPAFRRWFGDSKVVDEDGEPLVVYHMTPEEGFYAFDKNKIGDTNSMTFLDGFYFGNKAQEGSDWRKIDAYLSMEHPLDIDLDKADFDTIGAQEIADTLRRGSYSREYEDYLVRNGIAEGIEDARRIEDDLMENMDGVIIRNTQYDAHDTEYIVFEPNQIKSATDNNGEYSSENDDIRYRDGESEEETLQDIMKEQSMGMAERLTAAKAIMMQNHKGDVEKRRQAFEALAANLAGIRKAAGLQKEYDKATVKRIADLARVIVSSDMMSGAGKGEIKRMLSIVKNSTGKTELATQVNALFDLMLDHQIGNAEAMLDNTLRVKATRWRCTTKR